MIDDDEMARVAVQDYLEAAGFAVDEAEGGYQELSAAIRRRLLLRCLIS